MHADRDLAERQHRTVSQGFTRAFVRMSAEVMTEDDLEA